jgi:hypothetical protein
MPPESSVSDATIWSITLMSSIVILEASFYKHNMFIVQATDFMGRLIKYEMVITIPCEVF